MKPSKVAIIAADYPLFEQYCPHFSGMIDGLEDLNIENRLFSCRPKFDPEAVIEYRPDLVIYCLLDMVKLPESRRYIRQMLPNAKIVFWYGDYRDTATGQIHGDMSEIDIMFISNDAQCRYYKNTWKVPKVKFLPLGATIKRPQYQSIYDFDFVFLGSRLTKPGFVERAIEISNYKREGLRVIDADGKEHPDLRAKILKMMPSIYRSSKLCLDISHFTNVKGYTSNRFWNIPASGGVALTKEFPGCKKFYSDKARIYFKTYDQSLELKKKYLANPQLLEPIRKRALIEAENHTYKKRFLQMFEMLYN